MKRLLRGALAQGARLFGTALAVALAVTLVSGTFILTDTIDASFSRASADTGGASDVVVRSTALFSAQANSLPEREPVPETLVARVAAIPGVKAAWTTIQGYAELVDTQGQAIAAKGLPTVGSGVTPDVTLASGRAPVGPDEVAIDAETARRNGLVLGDRIKVLFSGSMQEFTIGGVLQAAGDVVASTKAVFDSATAQRVLGTAGLVDAIPVEAEAGLSPEALRARINAELPDQYEAVTTAQVARESAESWTKAVAFLPTALLLFAAAALLVGAFIICNTFSILVAQRARELALLRSLGASRAQLTASVLCEAVAVGVVGSLAGVVAGFGAARGLLALFDRLGYELPSASAVFLPRTAIIGVLAGVLVTVLAALLPARRATRVSPTGAMSGADGARSTSPGGRFALGAGAGAAGLATLLTGVLGGGARPIIAVGLGAAGIVVSLAVLAPLVATSAARTVGAPLVRLFGEPAFLGRENAMRSPRRTASTAAALMIGIGLVGVVAILAASVRASASRTVDDSLRADFVLTPAGLGGAVSGVPPVVVDRLRATPAIATVSEIRGGQWGLDGRTQTLLAVDPATVTAMHEVDDASAASVRRLDDSGVLVRDTVADRYGWQVGDTVPMTFARTGTQPLRLQATYSTTTVRSDYIVSLEAFEANYTQQLDMEIDVRLVAGTTATAGRQAIRDALSDFPNLSVRDRSEVLAAQETQIDRLLVPVAALLALSVVIALLGIANTLALSIHERLRELGMLRAIGMARGQLRSMVRSEALIVAGLDALCGVVVAVVFGWVAVTAMHGQGVTRRVFPVGQLSALAAVATLAGLAAAAAPARRAARLRVLDAVAGD